MKSHLSLVKIILDLVLLNSKSYFLICVDNMGLKMIKVKW